MVYLKRIYLPLLLLFAAGLSACGGGDNNDDKPPVQGDNSNWDRMVWDKDNWK